MVIVLVVDAQEHIIIKHMAILLINKEALLITVGILCEVDVCTLLTLLTNGMVKKE